jgi:APA family basic amino acid/polyamine antiporter
MSLTKYKPSTAAAVVIANMIGTGVFTSLGFQVLQISSGFVLLMLWFVGGITALCGALTYAELGAALPRSGGEYNFLTKIYHPVAGFISGWISSTIGFSAPTALAAITFGTYLSSVYPELSATMLAVLLVVVMTLIHATNRNGSGNTQKIFTALKLIMIVLFCVIAWIYVKQPTEINFIPISGDANLLLGSSFAVSLIFVNYAYNGWNAATYLSNELENPQRNVPRIIIGGTLLVMVLYLLLNFTFLYVAPIDAMAGKVEIGYVAAQYVFGETGAAIMGVSLALLLISTVSAMTIAGPRVLQMIGEDFSLFKALGKTNSNGIPSKAVYFQSAITLIFIFTSSFESILVFSGFALATSNLFTVIGIFVLRWKQPNLKRPYKTWLYPLTPMIYITITTWTLFYLLINRTQEALMSIGIMIAGGVFYYFTKHTQINLNK